MSEPKAQDRLYFRQLLSGRDYASGDPIAAQMRNFSYLIGDRETGEAVVVDPAYAANDLVDVIENDGMRLAGVLVTHHHPDHVGGTMAGFSLKGLAELLERQSVPVHVNTHEADWVSKVTGIAPSELTGHVHGDTVSVGEVQIELLHTPGHTPGSQCFLLDRRLHVLFAEAMRAAETGEPLPFDGAASARHLATVPADAVTEELGAEGIPLGRPSALQLLRRALTPGSVSLQLAARVGMAVAFSGVIAVVISQALTMTHAYWAMAAAVLMLHQGFDWQRTVVRGVERTLGTWVGLGVAGAILALHPQGLWLALVIGTLQFVIEMYVVRNYTLAVIFITPAALTIASGGQPVDDLGELLLTRGSDTLIGCAVALAVYWATQRLRHPTGLRTAVDATLDAVSATLPHLAADDATSPAARTDRRDLQLRAMELLPAYDASIGGSHAQRLGAERMWPTIVATEQLAYRTLAACWGAERDRDTQTGAEAAADTAAALAEQAAALREGLDERQ